MNILKTWFFFHKSERRYHHLSYNLLYLSSELNNLNEKRKITQKKIIELSLGNNECRRCQGRCCNGSYNHFTAIDYLIRRFSENPIESYGDLWKPKSILTILLEKIRKNHKYTASITQAEKKCPNLISTGCEMEAQDRPIRCILWTCKAFRQSLPPNILIEIGNHMRELSNISDDVIRIFRRL